MRLAAGIRTDTPGELAAFPRPLAGFTGQWTPREAVGKGMERSGSDRREGKGKRKEGMKGMEEMEVRRGKGFHTALLFFHFKR